MRSECMGIILNLQRTAASRVSYRDAVSSRWNFGISFTRHGNYGSFAEAADRLLPLATDDVDICMYADVIIAGSFASKCNPILSAWLLYTPLRFIIILIFIRLLLNLYSNNNLAVIDTWMMAYFFAPENISGRCRPVIVHLTGHKKCF